MLELKKVRKIYQMGDNKVQALCDVDLKIDEGDYVAIMGPSGSGKSTLMHILGLLDVPTSGSYQIDGKEVANLSEDELAVLRRDAIGFIFQQFNLLPRMTAEENVALPLLYSKRPEPTHAAELLKMVGLAERSSHKPNELSGGQQQRVAIARSLINRPRMILADEPTGNLDSVSEKEIMLTLKKLNDQGITVIIVTHEEEIGKQAKRLIRMRDGVVHTDERLAPKTANTGESARKITHQSQHFHFSEVLEYFHQGLKTLVANKIRTGLSMLGILIGVAAVVAMLALGRGAQKAIEAQLSSLGSNLLILHAGAQRVGGVSQEAGTTARITLEDVQAIKKQISSVKEISANVNGRGQITYKDKNWNTQILGGGTGYASMHASVPDTGRFFTEEENLKRARVAVIGATLVRELFGNQNPIGEMVKINKINFLVIGILPEKGATGWRDQDDVMILPVLTAMHRLMGKEYVDSVDLEISDAALLDSAQDDILELMYTRHRVPFSQRENAFDIRNMADIQAALTETSKTMTLLLSSIAAISLLVGGIGIMNIMLVSVTERTREIGLRKAIGARRWDILAQFLSEAIVTSATGGLFGIILGWLITLLLSSLAGWTTSISPSSVFLAFFFSASIGIIFGIYPAKKASTLHPIEALRYE